MQPREGPADVGYPTARIPLTDKVFLELVVVDVTRRGLLGAGAGGLAAAVLSVGARAASFGNPDEPAQGAINANPGAVRDPGPQNAALASHFPDAQSPPATDIGDMPQFLGIVQQRP
jgi:oxalate decarboxylase